MQVPCSMGVTREKSGATPFLEEANIDGSRTATEVSSGNQNGTVRLGTRKWERPQL